MFGESLAGQHVRWSPGLDPPGGWLYALGDDVLAELRWSRSEALVRAEVRDEVWRTRFSGVLPVHAVLADSREQPQAVYAGSLARGLVLTQERQKFVLFSEVDPARGLWVRVDDTEGQGVLRIQGRVGGGQPWCEVAVSPNTLFRPFLGRLLLLWGSLHLLRLRRPWLSIVSFVASERSVQRALERLAASVSF